MQSDFVDWLKENQHRAYDLYSDHLNPVFVKMLRTIGFDKGYVRGEGCYLWDADGNKYLDLLTGWGVFALGRNHPKIRASLKQVIDADLPNLVRMDCSTLAGLAAEMLTERTGGDLSRVFFCNSGTETVESAIKFARCFTSRQDILYCDHAFHGLTTGSLSLNGAEFFRERFGQLMPGTHAVPFNDLDALERALTSKKPAAFILEPVIWPPLNPSAASTARCSFSTKSNPAWAEPANGSATNTGPTSNPTSSVAPKRSLADSSPSAR
jgi:ornithine--oxo-acid transaminase